MIGGTFLPGYLDLLRALWGVARAARVQSTTLVRYLGF